MTVVDRVKAAIEKYGTAGLCVGLSVPGLSVALGSMMNFLLAVVTSC